MTSTQHPTSPSLAHQVAYRLRYQAPAPADLTPAQVAELDAWARATALVWAIPTGALLLGVITRAVS